MSSSDSLIAPASLSRRLQIIENTGFWGILMLASWPNAAFDLCGICCGTFMMPFWTFFGATLIGKSLIKAPMQAAFFVMLFSPASRRSFTAVLFRWAPSRVAEVVSVALTTADSTLERSKESGGTSAQLALLKTVWNIVIIALMTWFVKTIIEQLAQERQQRIDANEINKKFGRKGQ